MEVILTLYGLKSSVFFERIDVFLIKYGHASSEFFVKNRKKDHLIDFFGPHNRVVFRPNTGMKAGGVSCKI